MINTKLNLDDYCVYPMLTKEFKEYIKHDMETLHNIMDKRINEAHNRNRFGIKKVIFNDPATIILWADGTKTVVKCQEGDIYDPEKGLAMAISKKALGNQGNYYNTFSKHLKNYKEPGISIYVDGNDLAKAVSERLYKTLDNFNNLLRGKV